MGSTYTTNLNLRKPDHRDAETLDAWSYVLNSDFDLIDSAFGLRSYTEQNYIANSDSIALSLNKLDMQLYDVAQLAGGVSARTVILTPEYLNSTISADPIYAGVGTLTVGSELASNFRFNYFKWTSAAAALNGWNILIQWQVPPSFTGWNVTANEALQVDLKTSNILATENIVTVEVQKDGTAPVSSQGVASNVAGVWDSVRLGGMGTSLAFDAVDLVLTTIVAGDILNIRIILAARLGEDASCGNITLKYTG